MSEPAGIAANTSGPAPLAVSRRAFVAGAAMIATSALAIATRPRKSEHELAKVKLGSLVPHQLGAWKYIGSDGVVVAAEDEENGPQDGYDQLVTRTYAAPGQPTIMLLLAYGSTQGGSLQLHRPETCYPGQGFKLSRFGEQDMAFPGVVPPSPVHTRHFTATRDERIERIAYWTRIAQKFPRNTAEEYAAIFGQVAKGVVPDGILVRYSTIGQDEAQSDAGLSAFAAAMIAAMPAAGQDVLLGIRAR